MERDHMTEPPRIPVWGKGGPIRRIRGKGRGVEEEIAAEPSELGPRTSGISRRSVHYVQLNCL